MIFLEKLELSLLNHRYIFGLHLSPIGTSGQPEKSNKVRFLWANPWYKVVGVDMPKSSWILFKTNLNDGAKRVVGEPGENSIRERDPSRKLEAQVAVRIF